MLGKNSIEHLEKALLSYRASISLQPLTKTAYYRAKVINRLLTLQRYDKKDSLALGQQAEKDLREFLAETTPPSLNEVADAKKVLACIQVHLKKLTSINSQQLFSRATTDEKRCYF